MYNVPFMFQINSAAPFSREVKGKNEKGIKVTGIVIVDDKEMLLDIEPEGKHRERLADFLDNFNALPIDGEVGLKFTKQKNLVLKIGKIDTSVDLKKVTVRKGMSRKFEIKVLLVLKNPKNMTAAHIYEKFKDVETITIEQSQEELPIKEGEKKDEKVIESGDAFKKSEPKKSRRIPKNKAGKK